MAPNGTVVTTPPVHAQVGHSLENDLRGLRMLHMNVLDTAVLYSHPRGPPYRPALRVLCERHLNRKIQEGSHDSVADALATMELAVLKIRKARGRTGRAARHTRRARTFVHILSALRRRRGRRLGSRCEGRRWWTCWRRRASGRAWWTGTAR